MADNLKRIITIGTSRYGDVLITDRTIIRSIGVDTYCRLRKYKPDLYTEYIDCKSVPDQPSSVDGIIVDYDPVYIKSLIVRSLATKDYTELAQYGILIYDKLVPLQDKPGSTLLWIIMLFIVMFITIYYIVRSDIHRKVINYSTSLTARKAI